MTGTGLKFQGNHNKRKFIHPHMMTSQGEPSARNKPVSIVMTGKGQFQNSLNLVPLRNPGFSSEFLLSKAQYLLTTQQHSHDYSLWCL